MPRIELTKAAVERIRNTRYSRKMVYLDTDIRGLLLEYRPGGVGTWYFRAKDESGKSKMLRLGLPSKLNEGLDSLGRCRGHAGRAIFFSFLMS